MSKKKKRPHKDAWAEAKRLCGLTAAQVQKAKKLSMDPARLPGLRPSPSETWKLPVGEFIEECYAKSFSEDSWEAEYPLPPEVPPEVQAQTAGCLLRSCSDELRAALAEGVVTRQGIERLGIALMHYGEDLYAGHAVPARGRRGILLQG